MPRSACKSTNLGLQKCTTHPPDLPSPCGSSRKRTAVPRCRRVASSRELESRAPDISTQRERTLCSPRFITLASYGSARPIYTRVKCLRITPPLLPWVPPCPHVTTFLLTRPVPQIVSFTDGTPGPGGYTELSPDRFAAFRARAGAVNVLPYFVGSGSVVAQLYEDETLADATYKTWQLIILPVLVLILGIIGELFVPELPLGIPRREFGVYSWLALLGAQARGLSRVSYTRANWTLTFRNCNSRRLMTLVNS